MPCTLGAPIMCVSMMSPVTSPDNQPSTSTNSKDTEGIYTLVPPWWCRWHFPAINHLHSQTHCTLGAAKPMCPWTHWWPLGTTPPNWLTHLTNSFLVLFLHWKIKFTGVVQRTCVASVNLWNPTTWSTGTIEAMWSQLELINQKWHGILPWNKDEPRLFCWLAP